MSPAPGLTATANGRHYALPGRPVVAVCIDGSAPEYFALGLRRGLMPQLARIIQAGCQAQALCAMPSFTNPNNISIITGVSPAVHGISGNFFLNPETGAEVMMNEPDFIRAESLLAAFSQAGARVAVVTAKDKLRRMLGHGLSLDPTGKGHQGSVCFSSEKAHETTVTTHGISGVTDWLGRETPPVYSAALSEFVLAAGLRLLQRNPPHLMYLSLTDYVQHKQSPGEPEANRFYQALDEYFGAFHEAGALLGLTADHGMNDKHHPDGSPRVLYLGTLLDDWLGAGRARVILPITDPYVAHHGALGSFATIYLPPGEDALALARRLSAVAGVEYAAPRTQACDRFELPPDRVGDLVVVGTADTALGKRPEEHDLSQLDKGLRSHGGLAEQEVPFVLNAPLRPAYHQRLKQSPPRNFDLFDYLLNGTEDL